jgi:hypothetical protein
MSNMGKYIGISNRIPLVVLEYALNDYIKTGRINTNDYHSYIKEFTVGENRAKKSLSHLLSILNKNNELVSFISNICESDFYALPQSERKSIMICLFALTYPICYDILTAFSLGFKVQVTINKRVILDKIGAVYGSNRAMHIGIDETMPFLIETGIIERPKPGIFKKSESLKTTNQFVSELIVFTDLKLSNSKSTLVEEMTFRPWYSFFEISMMNVEKPSFLIIKKDNGLGSGYLTL